MNAGCGGHVGGRRFAPRSAAADPADPAVLNKRAWRLCDLDSVLALSYAQAADRWQSKDIAVLDALGMSLLCSGDLDRRLGLLDDARVAARPMLRSPTTASMR
jgi:hypothetical protein